MRDPVISQITGEAFRANAADLARIHQLAFGETDDRAARYRDEDIPEMSRCSGFAAFTASIEDQLVGFVVGYDATAIDAWYQNAMRASRGTPVEAWLPDAWYFADIAVHPDHQGHGIGTILHNRIMATVTDRRCMLITFHGNHPAKRFYCRLGWREVIPDLVWAPGKPLTSLMEFVGPMGAVDQ